MSDIAPLIQSVRNGRFGHLADYPCGHDAAFSQLDWGAEVPEARIDSIKSSGLSRAGFLPDDPGFAELFENEHRSWMASQFLNGEAAAAMICDGLKRALPDSEARDFAAFQASDEHRHHAVMRRFARERLKSEPFVPAGGFDALVRQITRERRWDMQMLGLQIMIEALALATFRLTAMSAYDPVLKSIASTIAVEEERHVGFGLSMLSEAARDWTAEERREREDFALAAASMLSEGYLMEDLWQRLGADPAKGAEFTLSDPMMIAFRRTVFSRIRYAIAGLGLMSHRVELGLHRMGLAGRQRLALA